MPSAFVVQQPHRPPPHSPAVFDSKLKETLLFLENRELNPDVSVYALLLGECSRRKTLSYGRRVHSHIIRSSLDRKLFLGNLLIKMYGVCGNPKDAVSVFNRMVSRNIITWTLMMDTYIQHGDRLAAISQYQEMYRAGIQPNNITLVSILNATSLHQGELIHASAIEYGFDINVILGTALINMYSKSRCLENAQWVFDEMSSRDVVAWNTLIAAYVHKGKFQESIQLYQKMQNNNVEPNNVSFVTLLGTCCDSASITWGLSLHASIVECGLESDPSINSTLVAMYGKCESIRDARCVFERRCSRNVVLWNSMMTVYVDSSQDIDALYLYEQMIHSDVKPNDVTFINVLGAIAASVSLPHGMNIHSEIILHNFESQITLGTALFNMYGKCGSIRSARKVFDSLSFQDLVTWNAMISVYISNKLVKEAFCLYDQMLIKEVLPDRFTFNTLLSACCGQAALERGYQIHNSILVYGIEDQAGIGTGLIGMYTKCGSMDAARVDFERQHYKDLALWNTMLSGYVQSNFAEKALVLYREMVQNRIHPDAFTFTAVVSACSSLAALAQGKEIHTAVIDGGYESDSGVQNALVHMYSKCGNMTDAWSTFEKQYNHDIISWNAMISGYAQHGYGKEALQVYEMMQKQSVDVNEVTFSSIFAACAHVGLVDNGLECFDDMTNIHGIIPSFEHYAGIVDLFGRVGRITEAEKFVNHIPVQPDDVIWKVLLGSCKVHNNVERGTDAAKKSLELDSGGTLAYVLLSNIYASDIDFEIVELDEHLDESCFVPIDQIQKSQTLGIRRIYNVLEQEILVMQLIKKNLIWCMLFRPNHQ